MCASIATAQGPHLLFTTSQTEWTLSGSGGTVLATLNPDEIAVLELGTTPCTMLSAEKWAPATMFHTQAGDTDGDDQFFEPSLFGRIDGLLQGQHTSPVGMPNQRTIYYSVEQPMGDVITGPNAFRPGDVARIVRNSVGDGQVDYFLRAEDLQIALGLPPAPLVVNLDACAWGHNYGVFFSVEGTHTCPLMSGLTVINDGDILCIPTATIGWTGALTVGGVMPGSAVVVYSEANVDAMVMNAMVADNMGGCVPQVGDVDALEIDWYNPFAATISSGYGVAVTVPHLLFAGSKLTGASVLSTVGGGNIHVDVCGPLGTSCGLGATLGDQMGLRPTPVGGVASSINALASSRICRFVTEAQQSQIPVATPISLDIASPGAFTWILVYFAPGGPGVVAPSMPFAWGSMCYPDYYGALPFVAVGPLMTTGFDNWTTGPIPMPVDFILQGVTITPAGTIEASTPTTVEVF